MRRPNQEDGPRPLQEHKALQPGEYAEFDPDELKGHGERCQSIIYTDRLYLDPDHSNRSHVSFFARGMSKTAKAMQADLSKYLDLTGYGWKGQPNGWFELYDRFLFGRVGNYDGRRIVSFWGRGTDLDNPHAKGPTHLIPQCIQELYYKEAVDDDSVVVFGDGRVSTVGEILGGKAPGEETVDPKARERIELAKRMHLATGSEKKAIMAQLGVGGAGSKRSEWDTALQQLPKDRGGLAPGQNMWRMTSEAKQHALERALRLLESPSLTMRDAARIADEVGYGSYNLLDWMRESGRDPNGLTVEIYLAIWIEISDSIVRGDYELTEPVEPPPTLHELKVGGIKRDGHRTPLRVRINRAQFHNQYDCADDDLWDMLMVGFCMVQAHGTEEFEGMSPYCIGALTHCDEYRAEWVMDHWFPDFDYLKQLRLSGKSKYPGGPPVT